jgi:hypothetical protein
MVDRPDWNAPAAPSLDTVAREMQTQDQPSPKTAGALGEAKPTVVSTKVRDDKGNIIRPDWSKPTPTVHGRKARPKT